MVESCANVFVQKRAAKKKLNKDLKVEVSDTTMLIKDYMFVTKKNKNMRNIIIKYDYYICKVLKTKIYARNYNSKCGKMAYRKL
jgi:hypothetical protein